jgi:hypothetical protein
VPEAKTSPRRVTAKLKQAQAIQLRKAGLTFRAIKDALGYRSEQSAYDAVKRGLEKVVETPAKELRDLDVERLDGLLRAIYQRAIGKPGVEAELPAIDRVLKILESRARLLGLNQDPGSSADNPLHTRNLSIDDLAELAISQGYVSVGGGPKALPDGGEG